MSTIKKAEGGFPGGPVANTLCSQCRGPGFDPWLGNVPHAAIKTQHNQINIKNNKNEEEEGWEGEMWKDVAPEI